MEWIRGRAIGRGSSAAVWLATARGSSEVFAVKSVQLSESECLRREREILSSLESPRVIAYKGFDFDASCRREGEGMYNLFMELAPGGSLSDELRRRGGALSEAAATDAAREILLGLQYLHARGLAHCDVKAANVLLTGEGLKIADFGCAKWVGDRHVAGEDWVSFGGTPAYMAPEVARGEEQGFAADVWAFGCTVIEMLTGRVWVDGLDPSSVIYRVGILGHGPEIPGFVSEAGRDFLGKCLRRDAGERWSASELLKHPFLVGEGIDSHGFVGSGFELDTPRSVLECNEFTVLISGSEPSPESGSDCPGERIKRLSGDSATPFWMVNDWAFEEGWVTVRDNWAHLGPNELCFGSESDWASDDEPIERKANETIRSICRDYITYPIEFTNGLRDCKDRKRESCGVKDRVRDWRRGLFMPSKCTKGHILLCDCSTFENNILWFLFVLAFLFFALGKLASQIQLKLIIIFQHHLKFFYINYITKSNLAHVTNNQLV